MSYAIYTFAGIIIKTMDVGENSRLLWLATDDSGVVLVRAQGLREEKSKMRAFTQLFSFVKIEVIRGKDGWKLVGCSPLLGGEGLGERSFTELSALSEMCFNLVFESQKTDVPDLLDLFSRFISLLQ